MLVDQKETATDSFGISLDTVEGGVYTDELNKAEEEEEEGRVGKVGLNPDYPINVVIDIGVSDYTAIWFSVLKDTSSFT
ncbi:hypothetical protein AGMMS49592_5160 [Endomicrobiia bacterium]|nr:hypothetical protein AGMMS49592_5160 [Endomicrobiia bacterium]